MIIFGRGLTYLVQLYLLCCALPTCRIWYNITKNYSMFQYCYYTVSTIVLSCLWDASWRAYPHRNKLILKYPSSSCLYDNDKILFYVRISKRSIQMKFIRLGICKGSITRNNSDCFKERSILTYAFTNQPFIFVHRVTAINGTWTCKLPHVRIR